MNIREKNIPENTVAITEYLEDGLNNSLYEVFEWAKRDKIKVNGVPFAKIENILDSDSEKVCGLSISGENLNPPKGIEIKTYKEHDVLTLIHIGSYKTVDKTYNILLEECAKRNYKTSGVSYLIFINNPFYKDENQLFTEVQLIIEK